MRIKDFLKQAYRLNEMINNDFEEIRSLRSLAISIGGANYDSERVQSGKVVSRTEETIAKIVDFERHINEEIDRLIDLKREIREMISTVENRNEQLLLRLRYIEFLPWGKIAQKMGYEERQIHRIHAEALISLENMSWNVSKCHPKTLNVSGSL